MAGGTQGCISVGVACCVAGIVAGCLTMTGLANQILHAIIGVSGNAKLLALFLTMLCCIVLGMGVPTTANYCIMATTCAPILVQMGIPTVAAHFFVFYFGIVADLTPPVALAAYAGAAIAGANPMKTAFNATKLAIAAFIIPYILAYNPAMVLVDTTVVEVVMIAITSLIGMFGLGMALEGYYRGSIPLVSEDPLRRRRTVPCGSRHGDGRDRHRRCRRDRRHADPPGEEDAQSRMKHPGKAAQRPCDTPLKKLAGEGALPLPQIKALSRRSQDPAASCFFVKIQ